MLRLGLGPSSIFIVWLLHEGLSLKAGIVPAGSPLVQLAVPCTHPRVLPRCTSWGFAPGFIWNNSPPVRVARYPGSRGSHGNKWSNYSHC